MPKDLDDRDDIDENREIYRESVKKLKYSKGSDVKKVKFEG